MNIKENYCINFDKTNYDNAIFKEILIGEVKRYSKKNYTSIKDYYSNISFDELKLQIICVDATLSRGTLALCEKYMIKNNINKNEIKYRINKVYDNYIFYLSARKIYNKFINYIIDNNLKGIKIIYSLKYIAQNGYFDNIEKEINDIIKGN